MAHPLIIDGETITQTLVNLNKDENWVSSKLESLGVCKNDIFLMTISDDEKIDIIKKEEDG